MPSGKRARQQRQATAAAVRTPPPVRSKGAGGARARQASPRALAIAGGVVLLIVIAVVLGVVLSGGSGGGGGGVVPSSALDGLPPTGSQSWAGSLAGAAEANALFKGIPQNGEVVGDPKAPIEMLMFIDVQCPVCQNYEVTSLPTIVKKYIRTGKVQLRLKPWAFIGPQSDTGRLGVIAAAQQNKGSEYAKVLYDTQPPNSENSGWLDGREMAVIAASVNGLDLAQWRDDVNSSTSRSTANAVDKLATQMKIQGTPTVLVGCTDGKPKDVTTPGSPPTLQDTTQAIDAAACS
ncbi:MAG TPA: thioredoxin domain-containing protein [Gaiellaceae bacterium]|jgi:protein-disulfide isomerase|nr:thioredoxin domain-containing protein [Gaiellaceae bacterium]